MKTETQLFPTFLDEARELIAPASGVLSFDYGDDNLAASQTDVKLFRTAPGSAVVALDLPVVLPFRGSIIGIAVVSNANKTAGTCAFRVFNNDAFTGASLSWADTTDKGYIGFSKGTYGFAVGDELDVRILTNSGFLPTTVDVIVTLFVYVTQSSSL